MAVQRAVPPCNAVPWGGCRAGRLSSAAHGTRRFVSQRIRSGCPWSDTTGGPAEPVAGRRAPTPRGCGRLDPADQRRGLPAPGTERATPTSLSFRTQRGILYQQMSPFHRPFSSFSSSSSINGINSGSRDNASAKTCSSGRPLCVMDGSVRPRSHEMRGPACQAVCGIYLLSLDLLSGLIRALLDVSRTRSTLRHWHFSSKIVH